MNEISKLVRPVSINVAFFVFIIMDVNSPIFMKLAQAILNAVSTLRSAIERGSSSVIFSRMSFIIRKRFHFLLGNSLLMLLMMRVICKSLKSARLRHLLI